MAVANAPPTEWEEPKGTAATPPAVPTKLLLTQFWRDIFGKEVQSAATYSYLWMADQMGHVALGLILQFALAALMFGVFGVPDVWANGIGFLGICGVVGFWEFRAYSAAAANANSGTFPLDRTLLRDNAVIATAYMVFGALAGYAFHLPVAWGTLVAVIATLLCIYYAPFWLRQKIIWQKAALPYLSRLADLTAIVPAEQAKAIQAVVDADPGTPPWRQIVIAGPVGSGRTPMVTGLGTDLAFQGYKVRYLSFGTLLEIADQTESEHQFPAMGSWGPKNIFYWPWFESQVLLIDDISPVIDTGAAQPSESAFHRLLSEELGRIQKELSSRHTVWVFALENPENEAACDALIETLAADIKTFCGGLQDPITVRLGRPAERQE